MKTRLPKIIGIICLLFIITPNVAFGQSPMSSPSSSLTVKTQAIDILDFLRNLLGEKKIEPQVDSLVRSKIPPIDIKSSDSASVVENTAVRYTLESASRGVAEKPKPVNILDSLLQFLGLQQIADEGSKNAESVVKSNLPQSVDAFKSAGTSAQIQTQANSQDADVKMVDSINIEKMKRLPYGIHLEPLTPTPTPTPEQPSNSNPTSNPGTTPLASCEITSDTSNLCYWRNFTQYFSSERDAKIASKICYRESRGFARARNDHCLASYPESSRTRDYSVGLFQINLLAHQSYECADSPVLVDNWSSSGTCSVIQGKEEALNTCVEKLWNASDNIQAMLKLRQRARNSWGPWSTYDKSIDTCTDFYEAGSTPVTIPGGGLVSCEADSLRVMVPNTSYKKVQQSKGCTKPSMIVIHWSGAWSTAEATYNQMNVWKTFNGQTYQTGCQFATDTTHQLQMQDFWASSAIWGYCVGGDENEISINDEITGLNFDAVVTDSLELDPANPRYADLKAESDRSIATTCWALKQYNIPKSNIIGHLESPYGKSVGKPDPGKKYIQYYRKRVNNECN